MIPRFSIFPVFALAVLNATLYAAPPNIVLITADDLGMEVGCYGYAAIKTPHLDKLATEGMRFTRAYVTQASCSPSRSSMFTGLYPHQNGQYGLAPFEKYGYRMHEGIATMPRLLKDAGYRTAILGKIHVEPETPELFPSEAKAVSASATTRVQKVADDAAAFIAGGKGPFFLMVNYFDPHRLESGGEEFKDQVEGLPTDPVTPEQARPFDFEADFDFPDLRKQIAGYLNSVKRLDEGIGLLLEKLEKTGVTGDTLVIFLSDHGAPFTLAKCSVLEAGVRVPMIVRWPGQVTPGTTTDFLTSAIDLLPTVLAAADVSGPAGLSGLNLLPLLKNGEPGELKRDLLFTEFTAHAAPHYYPKRAVRDDRYKLIWNLQYQRRNPLTALGDKATQRALQEPESGTVHQIFERWLQPPEFELYDLDRDPHEFVNLAGTPALAETERNLKDALVKWRAETNDTIGSDTPNPSEKVGGKS